MKVKKVNELNNNDVVKIDQYIDSDNFKEYVDTLCSEIDMMYKSSIKKDLEKIGFKDDDMYKYVISNLFSKVIKNI